MASHTTIFALLSILCLFAVSSNGQQEPVMGEPTTGWRPVPPDPIKYEEPMNWTTISKVECPAECVSCCADAWGQVSWVLATMSTKFCFFCKNLRYFLGKYSYRSEDNQCRKCLMDDFQKVATYFSCTGDFGKCQKCCMDLTLVYMAKYVAECPEEVWKQVRNTKYKSSAWIYDGTTSCPPPPSPSPDPNKPPPPSPQLDWEDWEVVKERNQRGTPIGQKKDGLAFQDDTGLDVYDLGQGLGK